MTSSPASSTNPTPRAHKLSDEERLGWVRLGVEVLAVVVVAVIGCVALYHSQPTVAAVIGVLGILVLLLGRARFDNPGLDIALRFALLGGVTIAAFAAIAVVALLTGEQIVAASMGALVVVVVVVLLDRGGKAP